MRTSISHAPALLSAQAGVDSERLAQLLASARRMADVLLARGATSDASVLSDLIDIARAHSESPARPAAERDLTGEWTHEVTSLDFCPNCGSFETHMPAEGVENQYTCLDCGFARNSNTDYTHLMTANLSTYSSLMRAIDAPAPLATLPAQAASVSACQPLIDVAAPLTDRAGTPGARLDFLLRELALRFPVKDRSFQSDPPELCFRAAIDEALAGRTTRPRMAQPLMTADIMAALRRYGCNLTSNQVLAILAAEAHLGGVNTSNYPGQAE